MTLENKIRDLAYRIASKDEIHKCDSIEECIELIEFKIVENNNILEAILDKYALELTDLPEICQTANIHAQQELS